MKSGVKKVVCMQYDIGDIVQSITTNEIGIVIGANPEEDTYQIFFFKDEETVPYNSEYIYSQVVFHVPINDVSDIRRCYLDDDKVKSVPLTMKG